MKILFILMAAIGLPLFILSSLTRPVRQVSLEWELAVVNAEADGLSR